MFKRSRRRIVAAIMSILVLVWVGTLAVIFASSYAEMSKQNRRMLREHANMFAFSQKEDALPPERHRPEGDREQRPAFDAQSPMFQLSRFYTVAFDSKGELLGTDNNSNAVHSNEELEQLARKILKEKEDYGNEKNLAFYRAEKDEYVLIVFMDNTVINKNAQTLLRYTLLFGGAALILFFFLSVYLARRIVDPLEKSFEKQKRFISDAGHELKTPVSVVSANAELLSREIGTNQWLSNIQYENERMGTLVSQLLELARTENLRPVRIRLDFSRLVDGEALAFESVAFEKGMNLISDISAGIYVLGDEARLKQIVSILLDNAIEHSKGGNEIRLLLKKVHGFARLSVVNQGDAISEEERERLFERFYRRDQARSDNGGHYGLGLAIAKSTVNSHKGQIEVNCYKGLIEFSVKLPSVS